MVPSHLVEVLLDSCFRVSVRIEDGEVSPALPLKVPQREKNTCGRVQAP